LRRGTMPYLVGELVDLAPPGDDLLPYFVTWENDPALLRLSDSPSQAPRGWDGARSMFDALRSGPGLFYGIYAKGGHPIGYLGANIDDRDRRACVYIVVGDAGYQGRGYGTDAMRVLLRHLFDGLGLHRAYLFVHESNQRAIRCYEKCGFVWEGRLREHLREGSTYSAEIAMGVLAHEFRAVDPGPP